MFENPEMPSKIIEAKGWVQISDEGAIKGIVEGIINAHPNEVQAYRNGKTNLLGFFVGQVMKQTRGQANPSMTSSILKEEIDKRK